MKIIVLSDTHLPKKAKELPAKLIDEIKTANHLLHLGDWQSVDVYLTLKGMIKIDGVAGNVDDVDIVTLLGYQKIVSFNGINIGLVHGHLGKGKNTEERAYNTFSSNKVDLILFGHSHIPIYKIVNGVTLFNPGSPTDKRRHPLYSFGVIHIADGDFSINHLFCSRS
ncbi:metallophosphoesterase family protein [Bacillus sp. AK128]